MTPKQHPRGDDAATLHALADALHKRAMGHYRDALGHATAGDWNAAEAAMKAAQTDKTTADALADEAEQV